MSAGIKANNDGSGAIQVGGSDYITISSVGAVAIPQTLAVTGTSTFTGAITATGGIAGDFRMNSGYGSIATAYGCRAWVNFNGTANTNLSGTYSQSGTTVTVTATAHGLIAGNVVYSDITTGTAVDGTYTVATVTDANTFTYTAGTSLTTSGNITLLRNTIRGSGNVSSIADLGVGDYTVNFSTAMPDANYQYSLHSANLSTTTNYTAIFPVAGAITTSSIQVRTIGGASGYQAGSWSVSKDDKDFVNVAIFR